MKKLLSILLLLVTGQAFSQYYTRDSVNVPVNQSGSSTVKMLIYYPSDYSSTAIKYPVIYFGHGAGERGTNLANIYRSSGSGGPNYFINQGTFPTSFVSPTNGLTYKFLILTPQSPSWKITGDQWNWVISYCINNFRIDTTMMYAMGLSAGAAGIIDYAAHLVDAEDAVSSVPRTYKFAAMNPHMPQIANPPQSWANTMVGDSIKGFWNMGDPEGDLYGEMAMNLNSRLNTAKSGISRFTNTNNGHSNANQQWNPTYKEVIGGVNMNVYEWFLTNSRRLVPDPNPSANAGSDQSILLPTNSVTLTGVGSGGNGHTVSSYAWTKISGPTTYTITSPSASSTTVTNLVSGTYVFRLTVTNEIAVTATDDVQIIVNSPTYSSPTITVSSGNNVSITLPTNSVNLTSSYTTNGAGVNGFNWQFMKTPAYITRKLGVIGSSTPAGAGATIEDSSYIKNNSIVQRFLNAHGMLGASVINLAVSGQDLFNGMRSNYIPTGIQSSPVTTTNITAILTYNPDVILVDYNNRFDEYTITEVMAALRDIRNTAVAAGKIIYFATPRPREDYTTAGQNKVKLVADSMKAATDLNVIDMYYPSVIQGTTQRLYPYSGDNIHNNNGGHKVFGNATIGENMFGSFATTSAVITSPNTQNTSVTGLTAGTYKVLVTITDSHEQVAYDVVTITVNAGSLGAQAGSDQSITLPTNSVTLDGSSSSGTITSYSWTRVSGPNTPTFGTPTAVTTTVSGLIQGTYVFQLSLNGGASTDQVTVTVNAAPAPPPACGTPVVHNIIADPGDGSVFLTGDADGGINPGDTLNFTSNTYSDIALYQIYGNPECPVVIKNVPSQVYITGHFHMEDCEYLYLTKNPTGNTYGFKIENDPVIRQQGQHAIEIKGLSKGITVENVDIHNVDMGVVVTSAENCDPARQFPLGKMDSIIIRNVRVVGTWNEGMYLGPTAPDNDSTAADNRPVDCPGASSYPKAMRIGHVKVYNCYVDSTGRGGIQISGASEGPSEIYNNVVKHSGLNGDDAQGACITVGAYSGRVWVHDNVCTNSLTWGIASIGGSATNYALRIENNTLDSCGYLTHYDLATTSATSYNPNTEPTFTNVLPWPQAIEIDTRPTQFTDSTLVSIINNTIKLKKNAVAINIENNYFTLQKSGHVVCGNTVNGSPATLSVVNGITVTTACAVQKYLIKSKGRKFTFSKPN